MIGLTPQVLRAAYSLLVSTRPFNRWKMPDASKIKFEVRPLKKVFADHLFERDRHIIRVSAQNITQLSTLLIVLAHEMVHIRVSALNPKAGGHGALWNRLADQVCRWHGFDRGAF